MKFPVALSRFEALVPLGESRGFFHFRLANRTGWTLEHGSGLLVAISVAPHTAGCGWISQASLWLASTAQALDDCLYSDDEVIWLVRRHETTAQPAQLELSLSQMLAVTRWFAALDAPPAETPGIAGHEAFV